MSSIKEREIRESLTRLKTDELFRNAPRYAELLEYLVEKAIQGEQLKEMTIGLELFNKQYDDAERNTGSVRVYMFNLRKRLNEYYPPRGADEPLHLELSKGSYNISFIRSTKQQNYRKRRYLIVAISTTAALVALMATTLLRTNEPSYCWEELFKAENTVTLVLADHITVRGSINGEGVAVQHPKITTQSEYLNYIQQNHCDTLQLNDFPLYSKAIPHAVKELSRWFVLHNKDFNIISESELKFNETKRSNLIYVGQSKTMNISKSIFLNGSSTFSIDVDRIMVNEDGVIEIYKPQFKDDKLVAEYAFVSHIALQDGNEALYFVSNNDVGAMATVRRFTSKESLKEFYKELPDGCRYFNALFKVSGVDRNDVDCELVKLEVLDS